ncbi:MAG: hypothetical protein JXA01_04400 [Dehalococcoidia bacterium]|nr:hypothetical protein [Dehalococcoidia bacterium]
MKLLRLITFLSAIMLLSACTSIKSSLEPVLTDDRAATDNQTAISLQNNYTDKILVEGLQRSYLIHLPVSYDRNRSWPLVIALHGGGGTGRTMDALTDFNALADKKGFIVVYPEGFEHHWNDGRDNSNIIAQAKNIDDVGFISTLIDLLQKDLTIDRQRVYAAGISNGAMMCHRLGCELSDKIAAIAPVAGNIPQKMVPIWSPPRPVSVLIINGTEDAVVPYEGGEISFLSLKTGKVISAADTVNFWITHNGCVAASETDRLPHLNPEDSTLTVIDRYTGCQDNVEVVFYTVNGGGHTWPGGLQYMPERMIGKTSRDFKATEIIWEFFEKHWIQ